MPLHDTTLPLDLKIDHSFCAWIHLDFDEVQMIPCAHVYEPANLQPLLYMHASSCSQPKQSMTGAQAGSTTDLDLEMDIGLSGS